MVIVVMGAAGAGKTTIGRALAVELGWRFVEGDDYHSAAAVAKMRGGTPLNDADRAPWLANLLRSEPAAVERREHAVIACWALKQRYRDVLRGALRGVRFVYLKANEATLRRRLEERRGHYAGPALVASQLADLEEPADAVTVDAATRPADIAAKARYEFGL